jgi:gluconate 5-dehydrogenase
LKHHRATSGGALLDNRRIEMAANRGHVSYRPGFFADQYRLDGKVALISGGHGALAEAMAFALADLGCDIALAARQREPCAKIAQSIERVFGRRALGFHCDVTNEADVADTIDQTCEQLGKLDILINNAGVSWWGLPQEIPLSGWQKVIDVNLTGTFLASREAARRMIGSGGGSIINITSVGAYLSYTPDQGQVVPYTTSKAAIVHLTRDLAAQWAEHGIRVNAVAPGSMETGLTETLDDLQQEKMRAGILLGRFGRPVELTGAIAMLASDAGAFITGQTIVVDGGQSIG